MKVNLGGSNRGFARIGRGTLGDLRSVGRTERGGAPVYPDVRLRKSLERELLTLRGEGGDGKSCGRFAPKRRAIEHTEGPGAGSIEMRKAEGGVCKNLGRSRARLKE